MPNIEISITSSGARLVATKAIKHGSIVHQIKDYRVLRKPTYQTVQTGLDTHIEESYLSYMNHSCSPNVAINTTTFMCVALRNIKRSEELHFFYPSTEWEMDRPFTCHCGSPQCLQIISGAKHLALDTLNRQFINQHVRLQALMQSDTKAFEQRVKAFAKQAQ